jgi:hypothetical protein
MLNPCFPLRKGLSFTFMLSLHLLSLWTDEESIVVILSIMCIVPKFIIDWFMIMVLLVLKLSVSSHPFELWRCPMHLCFATPWRTSWIPLCYVFSMLQTNKWLSMHYYSWSFIFVTFHVVTWLLSSMVRIISFMPMLEYFDPSLQCFTSTWSRLCWHVTSKIIFCYHLPTRGRVGVKLGDAWCVANVSIIFDAPCLFYTNCFMFCLHFLEFLCIFQN